MAEILVVDDSPTVITMLRNALEAHGHRVRDLDLMVMLPQILANDPPDLILLDLEMPLLSGAKVGELIRRFQKAHIPIVLFSSSDDSEQRRIAAEIEAEGWLQKGEPEHRLLQVIENALPLRRSASAA